MAENKNLFIKSKMNKDLDDRLVPNGEYRNAINIMISRSESQDVGAVETVLGNNIIQNSVIGNIDNLSVIGVGKDEAKNRIFLFLTNYNDNSNNALDNIDTSVGDHYITMLNTVTNDYKVLVTGGFLNFSKSSPVLGVNAVEDYLFFTDNRNQPRKINIERAIESIDPVTGLPNHYTTEDNISIVKYYPFDPVKLWEYDTTAVSVQANMKAKSIEYNPFNYNEAPDANPNPTYDATYAGDPDFMKDKFIRFSYRFKFEDNEYSLIAPFSQVAFIPLQDGFFCASSSQNWVGRDNVDTDEEQAYLSTVNGLMENKVDSVDIVIPLPTTLNNLQQDYKITEVEILYKESDNTNIKLIETIKPDTTSTDDFIKYSYLAKKSVKILPEDQLTRVSDQAPIRALSQEIVGNRVLYGNFLDRYRYPQTIDYKVGISEKFATNYVTSPSNPLPEVARVEYPNHTLKRNRTYQVGIVLSDRYGRQSPVILNGEVTSETIGGVEYGSSTITHEYGGDPYGSPPEYGPWPGTSVLNWTGDTIKLLFNNKIEVPELPNKGLYDPIKNPLGWYSYKVVVQQTEQEYYNVYLPGILNGYPTVEYKTDIDNPYLPGVKYDDKVAHIVLTGDNINKVPRDLAEVGPDQKKFRSSIRLYGRVVNVPDTTDPDPTPPGPVNNWYDSTYNKQYYPAARINSAYSPLNFSSENYHIASEIGTFSDLGLGETLGVFGVVTKHTSTIYAIGSGNDPNTTGVDLYLVDYNPEIKPGMFVSAVTPIGTPTTGNNVDLTQWIGQVVSNVENPEYNSSGTVYTQTGKGIVTLQGYGNATILGDIEVEEDQRLFFSSTQMYDLVSNPLIARIETKRPIGTSVLQATIKNARINPYLAVYETEPTISNLDIFYETTTSGLISDLNTAIDTGLTLADNISWAYNHNESYNIGTSIAGTIAALGPGGTPLNNQTINLVSATSVLNGVTINRLNDFDWVETQTPGPGTVGEYELRTNNYFAFTEEALNDQTEVYTFSFEIIDGGTNPTQFVTKGGSLSNSDTSITASIPNRIQLPVDNAGGTVVQLTGQNGSFDAVPNNKKYEDLVWEIAYQYKESDPQQNNIENFELVGSAGVITLPSYSKYLSYKATGSIGSAGIIPQLEVGESYVVGIKLYDASTTTNIYPAGATIYNVVIDIENPRSNLNLPSDVEYKYLQGGLTFIGPAEAYDSLNENDPANQLLIKPTGNHPAFATGEAKNNNTYTTVDRSFQLVKNLSNKNNWNFVEWDYLYGWAAFPGNKRLNSTTWSPPINIMGEFNDAKEAGSFVAGNKYAGSRSSYHTVRYFGVYGAQKLTYHDTWYNNPPNDDYPSPYQSQDYQWGYGYKAGWQQATAPYSPTDRQGIANWIEADDGKSYFVPRGIFFTNYSTRNPAIGSIPIAEQKLGSGFIAITFKMNGKLIDSSSYTISDYFDTDANAAFFQSHWPQTRENLTQGVTYNQWQDTSDFRRQENFVGAQWDFVGSGIVDDGKWNYRSVLWKNEEMTVGGSMFDTQFNSRAGQLYNDYYRGDIFYFKNGDGDIYKTGKYEKIRRTLRKGSGVNDLETFHVTGDAGVVSDLMPSSAYSIFPYLAGANISDINSYNVKDNAINLNFGRTVEDESVKLSKFLCLRNVEGWSDINAGTAYCEKTIVLDNDTKGELRITSGNLRRSLREVKDNDWDSGIDYESKYGADSSTIGSASWSKNNVSVLNGGDAFANDDNIQAEETSTSNVIMKDFYYSQEDPLNPGTFFTLYEYLAYTTCFADPAAIYDPTNLGDASNGFNNGNYGFKIDPPVTEAGGFSGSWKRVWAKEPCFGYIRYFYDRIWNASTLTYDYFVWKPTGSPGYVLYTQPIAAYAFPIENEDSIPSTTGQYALSTDGNPSPTTGNRSVGYPFGTNCAFGPKKRDPNPGPNFGDIVAGAGVWPYWHARVPAVGFNIEYDPNGPDNLDIDFNGGKKQMPHPFAVKMNLS